MSVATLTPQRDGRCLFELNGVTHPFGSYEEAEAEALARGMAFTVEPFPTTPITAAESPALRVL